jgi:orfA
MLLCSEFIQLPDSLYCQPRGNAHDSNIRQKVVLAHIPDVHTITSLVAEYGIFNATVSSWVRSCREECQNNDEETSQLEMMKEFRHLQRELHQQEHALLSFE